MLLILFFIFAAAFSQITVFLWLRREFSKLNSQRLAQIESQTKLEAELKESTELFQSATDLYKKATEDRILYSVGYIPRSSELPN